MTDRFRYLPCGLHEALAVPAWAMCGLKGELLPFVYSTRGPGDLFDVDLSHPAGWDHAVRAYVAICGQAPPESESVVFGFDIDGWYVISALGTPLVRGRHLPGVRNDTPAARREALCRCICAALNLDPTTVFPVEPA